MKADAALESLTPRSAAALGAIQGLIAWSLYGAAECFFSLMVPRILHSRGYRPLHWGFAALLLVVYPAIGALAGMSSALALKAVAAGSRRLGRLPAAPLIRASALGVLIVVFSVNFVVNSSPTSPVVLLSLALSAGLVAAFALTALSRVWEPRLSFLTNAWIVCLLLPGTPWLTVKLGAAHDRGVVAAGIIAYVAAVLLASFVVARTLRAVRDVPPFPEAPSPRPARLLFYGTVVAFAVFAVSFQFREKPPVPRTPAKSARPGAPHILLITMDTVRADHLSLHGYGRDTTPNLERLAAHASVYTRAVATGDMTLSTHASIFTGLYVSSHGAHYADAFPAGRPLPAEFATLAEILSDAGYFTAGIVANTGFLSDAFRVNQGFQHYDNRVPVHFLSEWEDFYIKQGLRNFLTRFSSPWEFDVLTRRAGEINAEALARLDDAARRNRPSFIFVNYMDAHWPYVPPSPFDRRYPGKDDSFTLARYFRIVEGVLKGERSVEEAELRHLLSQYDGAIAYMDAQIGELVDRLEKLGIYDDTLIVVTSDHGEVFGERGLMEHGVSVYQDQVHVPLIVKLPGTPRGSRITEVVSVVDILPTILDLLALDVPDELQGRSLLEGGPQNRAVIAESFARPTLMRWNDRFRRVERAVYSGEYKLVASTVGKREVYDLLEDPWEKDNIAAEHPELAAFLATRLNGFLAAGIRHSGQPPELDSETLQRLKSLGYVQ